MPGQQICEQTKCCLGYYMQTGRFTVVCNDVALAPHWLPGETNSQGTLVFKTLPQSHPNNLSRGNYCYSLVQNKLFWSVQTCEFTITSPNLKIHTAPARPECLPCTSPPFQPSSFVGLSSSLQLKGTSLSSYNLQVIGWPWSGESMPV